MEDIVEVLAALVGDIDRDMIRVRNERGTQPGSVDARRNIFRSYRSICH